MILESISILVFSLLIDFIFGDPKNKYHPTAWMGSLISLLVPFAKNNSVVYEKIGGILLVIISASIVAVLFFLLDVGITLITIDYVHLFVSIIIGSIILKTTIAIRGMENHANSVINALEENDIESARNHLSMIVKRKTKNLDKNHVYSGVIESISENTVDGITAPLFYFGIFGIVGALVYRIINTIDSMIGYKNNIFKNIGWFGANCDNVLNYLPSRITGFVMILSAMILRKDWKKSYKIMIRDGKNTQSPNAGYPMAAIAGALGTKFEKIHHYSLGDGNIEFTQQHVRSAISLMKITSILFSMVVVLPLIVFFNYIGWWIHA